MIRDEKWTALRDKVLAAVLKAAPGCTKKDQRPFQPHLTVANRDIPAGVSADALEVMNELNLVEDFLVDNMCRYLEANTWSFQISVFNRKLRSSYLT